MITCIAAMALFAGAASVAQGPGRQEIGKTSLKVGDKAPDFTLKMLDSDKTFKLSSNFGKKPTALIFGSYT